MAGFLSERVLVSGMQLIATSDSLDYLPHAPWPCLPSGTCLYSFHKPFMRAMHALITLGLEVFISKLMSEIYEITRVSVCMHSCGSSIPLFVDESSRVFPTRTALEPPPSSLLSSFPTCPSGIFDDGRGRNHHS